VSQSATDYGSGYLYLSDKLLMENWVLTWLAECLLEECEQDGDNHTRFQCLTEDDEVH